MSKWTATMPVNASAVFEMESEKKPTKDEFLDNASRAGYLCHSCARTLECDFEVLDLVYEKDYNIEIFEDDK